MPMLTTFGWARRCGPSTRRIGRARRSRSSGRGPRGPRPRRRPRRRRASWSRGMRSATCSTARSSETLMCSPANIASRRSASPGLAREVDEQLDRLVGDAVLRVVEVEPGGLGHEPPAPLGVVGEELAQRGGGRRCVVALEQPVRGTSPERLDRGHGRTPRPGTQAAVVGATRAPPTIPASLCSWAGTTVVRHSISGRNLSDWRLTPPPMMKRSGHSSDSTSSR